MSIWDKEHADIRELVNDIAGEHDGPTANEWRQKILSAIWLDQLPIVHCFNGDRDQLFTPFGRTELREAVAAFGELNVGRTFMGVPVRATSKILPTALPFETLAKLAWEAYSDFFIDVYLDRVLIKPAAVAGLFSIGPALQPKVEPEAQSRPRKPEKQAKLKARLEGALAYAREWPPGKPYTWIATRALQQGKAFNFDAESLRKIYAGQYRAMEQFGLKGINE